jgi:Zinc finger C-x8-C-x5-C-x3-H type (and similar)
LKTGTCKFGATCKFHHPREKAGIGGHVQLNVLGYPLRPVLFYNMSSPKIYLLSLVQKPCGVHGNIGRSETDLVLNFRIGGRVRLNVVGYPLRPVLFYNMSSPNFFLLSLVQKPCGIHGNIGRSETDLVLNFRLCVHVWSV